MQRNYVTSTRLQETQQKYIDHDEIAKKNVKLAIEWQRQRRQRNLEMNLAHRRHSHDVPFENYAVFSKISYPREHFLNRNGLPVWSNENMGTIEFWNGSQNSFCDQEDEYIRNKKDGDAVDPVVRNLTTLGKFLEILQKWPLPRLSLTTACIIFLLAIFISPRPCVQSLLFPAFRLTFGTLYPAYASYKAVRTKNVKEYVKWMMYWIVYAFFTCTETFTDIFLSWFPFYYEVKVIIVLWLLSPATKGSSTLYRKFVHPMLTRREQEIDDYLNQAKERGYSAVLQLGSKGVNYATNVIMQTALKGGGNLVQTLRRSYSLSDLSEPDIHRSQDEVDDVCTRAPQQRILRPRLQTALGRSASGTRHSTGMYFTEVDMGSKGAGDFNYSIRSSEDISSGYSSAEPVSGGLSRTSSMTNASKARLKAKRSDEELLSLYSNDAQYCFPCANEKLYYPPNLGEHNHFTTMDDLKDETFLESESYFPISNIVSTLEKIPALEISPGDNVSFVKDQIDESKNMAAKTLNTVNDYSSKGNDKFERFDDSENDEFMDTISTHSSDIGYDFSQNQVCSNYPDKEELNTVEAEECSSKTAPNASARHDEDENKGSVEENVSNMIPMKTVTVSPKDLKQALEEIKDNFRATINSQIKEKNPDDKPKPCHNKGQAPAPPAIPSRPARLESTDTISIHSSTKSNSRSSSPNERKATKKPGIFKAFKSSVFRSETKPVVIEKENSISSTHKETEI